MDRLEAMQVFAEVVKQGSFTAAAEQLDISRVKATRSVNALEDWLGARLLQRSTRRISLTEAGQACLRQCQQMLELEEELQSSLQQADQPPRGRLRVTASSSFARAHLAPAMADFLARYPQVSIDMIASDDTINLIEQRVDLAIRISGELDPGLVARRLAPCRSIVCASPTYLTRHGTPQTPDELSRYNCLTYSNFGKGAWRFERPDQPQLTVPVSGNFSANEASVLTEAVLSGIGIALQPSYLVGPLIREGRLVPLLSDWQAPELSLWGVYLSRHHLPASLRSLLDFLIERYQGTPDWDQGC
ncbi:LysR family transcriptional regulator [Motiliproteus sp.]|uniref:LysR family transcriptional regulator n=1 Tax=Motiliproteus sp. TaxID=1898955 RepID=UPI003BAD1FA0